MIVEDREMVTLTTDPTVTLAEVLNQTTHSNEVRYCRNQKDAETFIERVKAAEARWGRVEPIFTIGKVGRQVVVTVVRG
jgi:hypothetical protein